MAVSGHVGSATSDGGVLRRDRDAARHPLRLAAKLGAWLLTIALLVVAGFESSAFVGGIAFAVAGLIAAPILFGEADPADGGWRFVGGLAIAALLVVCLIAPFVRDQLAAIAARGDGSPLWLSPYAVFGESVSGLAAPCAGRSGLLAHHIAGRTAGDLFRRA